MPFPQPEDPLARVMTHPEFPAPLAMALLQTWPNAVLPGLDSFPMNRVALLETNPAFTAAFLAGVNHEMNREFLWREFPTDQRGTPFKHFWPRPPGGGSDGREIDAIVRWPTGRSLAANLAGGRGAETVLLVRGDVLRRFPNMIVMAAPALNAAGAVGPFASWLLPTFPVPFPNESMAYIFQLDVNVALGSPGWFFVFQEPMTVPRYGFDVSAVVPPTSWNDLAWGDVRAVARDVRGHRQVAGSRAAPDGRRHVGRHRAPTWPPSATSDRSVSSSTPGRCSMSNLSDLIRARSALVATRERLADVRPPWSTTSCARRIPRRGFWIWRPRFWIRTLRPPVPSVAGNSSCCPSAATSLEQEKAQLETDLARPDVAGGGARRRRSRRCGSPPACRSCFPCSPRNVLQAGGEGWDLLIRIYPDDLHIDSSPGPLTDREEASGRAYWQSVWPAIGNRDAI